MPRDGGGCYVNYLREGYMPAHMCSGQDTAAEAAPPFHQGSPGHQFKSSGLTSSFTHWAISLVPHLGFYVCSGALSRILIYVCKHFTKRTISPALDTFYKILLLAFLQTVVQFIYLRGCTSTLHTLCSVFKHPMCSGSEGTRLAGEA